jgi:hypothetical protein
MEESIFSDLPTGKLYSQRGIMISGILAGPVAVAYLLSRNCNALELRHQKSRVWGICVAAFAVFLIIAFILPPKVPTILFIFLNAAFGYYAAENLQGKQINAHIAAGGALHSNWRSAGIAFLFAIAVIILFLGIYWLADAYVG